MMIKKFTWLLSSAVWGLMACLASGVVKASPPCQWEGQPNSVVVLLSQATEPMGVGTKEAEPATSKSSEAEIDQYLTLGVTGVRTKLKLKVDNAENYGSPIAHNVYEQLFFRPVINLSRAVDIDTFPNTPEGVLGKFITYGNQRSCDVWDILSRNSQDYIVKTMVEFWRARNDGEGKTQEYLESVMRQIFENSRADTPVAGIFWKTYFEGTFGDTPFCPNLGKAKFVNQNGQSSTVINGQNFYMVYEDGVWRVDIVKTDLQKIAR